MMTPISLVLTECAKLFRGGVTFAITVLTVLKKKNEKETFFLWLLSK